MKGVLEVAGVLFFSKHILILCTPPYRPFRSMLDRHGRCFESDLLFWHWGSVPSEIGSVNPRAPRRKLAS